MSGTIPDGIIADGGARPLHGEVMRIINQDVGLARVELASGPKGQRAKREYRLGSPCRAALVPLRRHDPININYGDGPDIYLPESEAILTRLRECANEEQACRVVHEELCKSFGLAAVGPRELYRQIAKETWELWEDAKAAQPRSCARSSATALGRLPGHSSRGWLNQPCRAGRNEEPEHR